MENRLIELETRLSFQDHTLQELNAVVVRQQREIDALTRELETLKAQLKTLAPDLVASRAEEARRRTIECLLRSPEARPQLSAHNNRGIPVNTGRIHPRAGFFAIFISRSRHPEQGGRLAVTNTGAPHKRTPMAETKPGSKILRVLILDESRMTPNRPAPPAAGRLHAQDPAPRDRRSGRTKPRQQPVDLILCAHGLANLPARQVVELAARKQPYSPVIVLARRIADDELHQLMQAGARDVIIKGQWDACCRPSSVNSP